MEWTGDIEKEEHKEKQEIDLYGADAADWLRRWDEGKTVWSIEMGGLGPGYEQAIQVTIAEILRHLLAKKYDSSKWGDEKAWQKDVESIRNASFENTMIGKLGLSGAQHGAALTVAARLYRDGPRKVLNSMPEKKRHIQVSKDFPSYA